MIIIITKNMYGGLAGYIVYLFLLDKFSHPYTLIIPLIKLLIMEQSQATRTSWARRGDLAISKFAWRLLQQHSFGVILGLA